MSERVAGALDIKLPDGRRVWCPPTGDPYWTSGPKCPPHSCGPRLTEDELVEIGLKKKVAQ